MAAFKDDSGVYKGKGFWRICVYHTDWQGNHIKHEKRGFKTRREALEYERTYLLKADRDLNMSFDSCISHEDIAVCYLRR